MYYSLLIKKIVLLIILSPFIPYFCSNKFNIMKKITLFLFAAFLVGASISSCGKYEEGPKFTLQSKKARMTNTWIYTKSENNGVDNTPDPNYYTLTLTLKDDGTALADFTLLGVPYSESGNWAFSDNKEELILTDPSGTQNLEIIKLTKNELKVKQIENGDEIVTTYTAQ